MEQPPSLTKEIDKPPRRKRNHLTPPEVEALAKAARHFGNGRNRLLRTRDELVVRFAYNHGLRLGEQQKFLWEDINFELRQVFVTRSKGSLSSTHPLFDAELRLLKKWKSIQAPNSFNVFTNLDGTRLSKQALQWIVTRAGMRANLGFPIHHHMLRHGCGFKLINEDFNLRIIQQYLGHRNIQNTTIYTALSDRPFTRIRF